LIDLGKTAGHLFPLALKVSNIYKSDILIERLNMIGQDILTLLDFTNPDNRNKLVSCLPPEFLEGFDQRPFDVQCKMVLNHKKSNYVDTLIPLYKNRFPELTLTKTVDTKSIVFGLTMNLQPWNSGYANRIKDLDATNPAIKGLIFALVGDTDV